MHSQINKHFKCQQVSFLICLLPANLEITIEELQMIIFVAPANGIESQKVLFRNEPKMDTKYRSNPGQHLWREKAFLSRGEQSYSSIASLGQALFILICAFERLEWFVVATQDHGWFVSTLGLRVKLMQKGNEGSWRKSTPSAGKEETPDLNAWPGKPNSILLLHRGLEHSWARRSQESTRMVQGKLEYTLEPFSLPV